MGIRSAGRHIASWTNTGSDQPHHTEPLFRTATIKVEGTIFDPDPGADDDTMAMRVSPSPGAIMVVVAQSLEAYGSDHATRRKLPCDEARRHITVRSRIGHATTSGAG